MFENAICTLPSFLTRDEGKLLYKVVIEWKEHMREIEAAKALRKAQKQKDKFRQGLIDVYKDY